MNKFHFLPALLVLTYAVSPVLLAGDTPAVFQSSEEMAHAICGTKGKVPWGEGAKIIESLKTGITFPKRCERGNTFAVLLTRGYEKEVVQALLDNGVNPDYAEPGEYSARMTAACCSDDKITDILLSGNFDASARSPDGETIFLMAVDNEDRDVRNNILKQKISPETVNAPGRDGNSVLIRYVRDELSGMDGLPDKFAALGADFNIKSAEGLPLLQAATVIKSRTNNNQKLLDSLIKYGADVNRTNSNGENILNYMFHYEVSEGLLKYYLDKNASMEQRDNLGNTAILALYEYMPASGDRYRDRFARILLEKGADINAVNNRGASLITAVVEAGARVHQSQDIIIDLVKRGVKTSGKTPDGRGLLHYAGPGKFRRDVVNALLSGGADVNDRDESTGLTPLLSAILYENYDAAEIFIGAGADVNMADNDGRTPLMALCHRIPRLRLVEMLVKKGADTGAVDSSGRSALDYLHTGVYIEDRGYIRDIEAVEHFLRKKNSEAVKEKSNGTDGSENGNAGA